MGCSIHPTVSVTIISDEKVQFTNFRDSITIEEQNSNINILLQLLDGSRGVTEINIAIESNDDLQALFELLESRGFIIDEDDDFKDDTLDQHLNVLAKTYQNEFESTIELKKYEIEYINLYGTGQLAERVAKELANLDIKVIRDPLPSDLANSLIVCCSDTPDANLFEGINKLSIESSLPALFASLSEQNALVGPLVIPDETSCYYCFTHRSFPGTEFIEEYLANQRWKGNSVSGKGSPIIYSLSASYHVIAQILKFNSGALHYCLINEILDLNLLDYSSNVRPVLKVPNCSHCGSKRLSKPRKAIRDLV